MAPSPPYSPASPLLLRQFPSLSGTPLSSWGSCMASTYCKWPVIVGIILGALIVLSILVCIIRVCCLGVECCCCGISCLRCCCPSPSSSRTRKGNSQPPPNPWSQQQYQSQFPMGYGGYGGQPQFAQFDASSGPKSGRVHEDALPAMPSWQNAASRRVEDPDYHEDDVELEKLGSAGVAGSQTRPTSDESRQPMLPTSPYEEPSSATTPTGHQPYPDGDLGRPEYGSGYGTAYGGASNRYDNHARDNPDNYSYVHGQGQVNPYTASEYNDYAGRSPSSTAPPPSNHRNRGPALPSHTGINRQAPSLAYDRSPYEQPHSPYGADAFGQDPAQTYGYLGYTPSFRSQSTAYAPATSAAPAAMPQAEEYGGQRFSMQQGQGLPASLGVGRKPVSGSFRDV